MECSMLHRTLFLFLLISFENAAIAQERDSVGTGIWLRQSTADSITINGIILDSIAGEYPRNDSVCITIDSLSIVPDSEGAFFAHVPKRSYHSIRTFSHHFSSFSRSVPEQSNRSNYFITILLQRRGDTLTAAVKKPIGNKIASGSCWTVSGCIVDSKHDLAIRSDSFKVAFDDSGIIVSKSGGFLVVTCQGGSHTFHVKVPGYHEAVEQVDLSYGEKQPFITIQTTKMHNTIRRREITVSAKGAPVHVTSAVSKTQISRTEAARTASTLNDPARVVQTLPGVAAQSDVSARPIVRGGEPRETRVFLDDVPLIQPYHFGGGKSMFNELAMDNMTLLKSGFPPEYGNATSALLTVSARKPLSEPFALGLNCNLLQADGYCGIHLWENTIGMNMSFQSSYQDFFNKRLMDLQTMMFSNAGEKLAEKQLKDDITFPDYRDFSTGVEYRPNEKLHVYLNEVYSADNYKAINRAEYGYEGINAKRDTFIDYASSYNIFYGSARYIPTSEHIIAFTGAWQKRWWDIHFPAATSDFYEKSIYDVYLMQCNANICWLYSGIPDHILSSGVQCDFNRANFNVHVARVLHQIILDGNTNFADFWGPMTNDNGMHLMCNQFNSFSTDEMIKHVYVHYNGANKWLSGGLFIRDEWNMTPRLSLDAGARIEASHIDGSITFSPRLSAKYSLTTNNELLLGVGHYTQNNYDISSIALSNDLKPEKVWHGSIGAESRLLPWLSQKIDLYGKYYYDLMTEALQGTSTVSADSIYRATFGPFYADSLAIRSPQMQSDIVTEYGYSHDLMESHYGNNGRGRAFGLEYFLRYDPFDFWNGWLSLTLSHSERRNAAGRRWYPFPLDRPCMISLVNYYRLPRKYEISVKYHYMSGLPYTSVIQDSAGTRVGQTNDKRYRGYQRLDFKFSKGFTIKDSKAHFYIEAWNVFNNPNFALIDKDSKRIIGFDINMPLPMLFFGFDYQW